MAGENQGTKKDKNKLVTIPLSNIREDKNIRSAYDDEGLRELAESLKANGLLQPITVSEQDDGYSILYGHRRFRAAELARWTEIDCIVRKPFSDEVEQIIAQTIENEDRAEVPSADKEAAVLKLETEHGLTADQICERFGKSRGWYSQIKGAYEFREKYGKQFDEAGIPLYNKEAYKMKGSNEEQVKQAIEAMKSGSSKAGILGELSDNSKKETRGRKPKQKVEEAAIGFEIGDEPLEISTRIILNKDKTFTVDIEGTGKAGEERIIVSLRGTVCSHLAKLGFLAG